MTLGIVREVVERIKEEPKEGNIPLYTLYYSIIINLKVLG